MPIADSDRATVPGSRASRSLLAEDTGPVDGALALPSMVLDFTMTSAQKAELDALVASQQDIQSPLYHQWLSPEQYGARFGASSGDILAVETWLQNHGFAIERVARGKNHIVFSGTAALVEAAFGAPIHNFRSADGTIHHAPATELTLPAAIAPSVMAIRNLSNYLPHPRYIKPSPGTHSRFTDVNNAIGVPYGVTPGDLATIYDIDAAYNAGYNGAGQAIAVVGQSYVYPSDIATFQSLAGVPTAKAPIFVLVPGTGTPEVFAGDETESDLDLEYSSTIGKGAQVYFVYTGSYRQGSFYALEYAVDERIAPIISNSYGACEVDQAVGTTTAATEIADQDLILEQGVAQGQTILSAAGDDGSVDCIGDAGDALSTLQSAAVDYPASSPYNTSMGGTEFPLADYTTNASTYWLTNAKGSAPIVDSAKSYIPEQVWNDDDPKHGTSAGGGGVSLYEASPSWQTPGTLIGGVAIPTEPTINIGTTKKPNNVEPRLVPDISLYASPNDPGLLLCTSDSSLWVTGQQGSCTNGFYDNTGTYLTFAGGTSFDGPIFAGMLAIINQALNSTGQGNVNPTLYGIASSSTATYNSVFHDIASGSNACYDFYETASGYPAPPAPMPSICGVGPAVTEYAATPGYDMASGLGSIDLYNLLNAWPRPASSSLLATTTTLAPATATPAAGAGDSIAIAVASPSTTATGTVSIVVDGVAVNSSLALSAGSATYTFSSNSVGAHVVEGTYSGDATHAASTGTVTLFVGTTTPSFTLSATALSVTPGGTGTSTVTVTPAGGYTGLVNLTVTAPASLANACVTFTTPSVKSASAVSAVVTIYTNINNCPTGAVTLAKRSTGALTPGQNMPYKPAERSSLAAVLCSLIFLVSSRRRSRVLRAGVSLAFVISLSIGTLGLTGCVPSTGAAASSTTSSSGYISAAGTYALTVSGVDSVNPTLTSSTTVSLTVQ